MDMNARHRAWRWSAMVVALALLSACSSAWLDPARAQKNAAQRAAPAEIHATPAQGSAPGVESEVPPSPQASPLRVLRLRALATPQYAAQVVDWPRQLEALLDEVNRVLGPTLSARVALADTGTWVPRAADEDLSATVNELAGSDAGEGVDWVVGLVGSVPRFELSFHQLGMGRMSSKQFVLRAMNDAREYEAIQTNLSRLDERERNDLYRARRRHKATTVFLHELGHTLGVPHEVDVTTIMSPRYDPSIRGFSDAAAQMMRLALARRLDPKAQTEQAYAQTLLDHVQRTSASWVPAERDKLIAELSAAARTAPPPPPRPGRARVREEAPAADLAIGQDQVAALAERDRATYAQALEDRKAGKLLEAWTSAKPLFTAYPDVYPVQDLRCQLAMAMGGTMDAVRVECARLTELTLRFSTKAKPR
jgi:hypothetical protein